jgi:DNA (cytosine-5)-methyltransferase 1
MAYVVPNKKGFIKNDNLASVQAMKDWLGIQYDGNIYYGENHSPGQVLRNCVHPDLGLHIFNSIPT